MIFIYIGMVVSFLNIFLEFVSSLDLSCPFSTNILIKSCISLLRYFVGQTLILRGTKPLKQHITIFGLTFDVGFMCILVMADFRWILKP